MKLLKFIFVGLIATLFLPSCLDDGDSSFEGSAFVYIRQDQSFNTYAQTLRYGQITSEEIRAMVPGECAIMTFKVTGPGSGINEATTKATTKLSYKANLMSGSPKITSGEEIFPRNFDFDLNYGGYSPLNVFFNDNWLYTINFGLEDDIKVSAYFFYDKDNQRITTVGADGETTVEEAKDNEIVIDVRFAKNANSESFTAKGNGTSIFVGNLSNIRYLVNPKSTPDDYQGYMAAPVKFRYIRKVKDEKDDSKWVDKEAILGRWKTNSSSDPYYRPFFFEKEK